MKELTAYLLSLFLVLGFFAGCEGYEEEVIVLRISNWEEYIDLGDWDEEELIELENGTEIIGESSLVEDFEDWYYETYGKRVKVEYSTFGTNEELYNQLLMGDVFDLVCPSEYMIMKMQREGRLLAYGEEFYDKTIEENYYAKGVSPYIKGVYDRLSVVGGSLSEYAAGYMWGTLGIVYNPEFVDEEDAAHWDILFNPKYEKTITVKDSVRDAYFSALGIVYYDEITESSFMDSDNYREKLSEVLNRSDEATVNKVEEVFSLIKDNVYAFETDSGKADIATGKIFANEQWSGDAVYTLDVAEEEGLELYFSSPAEGTNLWFDGWVLLKDGIGGDADKLHAAQAFVNFVSRPDNAVRNMCYIGYTSVISGGEDSTVFDYVKYVYETEEEEGVDYPVGYFFGEDGEDESFVVWTDEDQTHRQLYAQYPPLDVMERSVVMNCFSDEDNERINAMWTNVRCFDPWK